MSRTLTPEEEQVRYRWLTTRQVAVRLGLDDQKDRGTSAVRALILSRELGQPGEVRDIGSGKTPNYRISEVAVDRYLRTSVERAERRRAG